MNRRVDSERFNCDVCETNAHKKLWERMEKVKGNEEELKRRKKKNKGIEGEGIKRKNNEGTKEEIKRKKLMV